MEAKFQPKISIIIPVYNGANYLRNSIDCALNQDYPNFEVIVVNDGSTDNGATESIALSYGNRIRYFKKINGGVSSALNFAIERMEGEYFSWLSHDDMYAPTKLSNGILLLSQFPNRREKLISFSWGNYIDESGKVIRPFHKRLQPNRLYTSDEMVMHMLRYGTLNGCCMLIPKSAFVQHGGFNEDLRYSQDTLMWFTLFFNGYSLIFDENADVMYRLHGQQTSQTRRDLFERDSTYIARKLAPYFQSSSDNRCLYLYAKRLAKYGCRSVVDYMRESSREVQDFTFKQNVCLEAMLIFSKFRAIIKKIRNFF